MKDLIDRQAAIDAVKKNTFRLTFAEEQNCEGHVAWSANAVYSDVIEGALLELPSAQPEHLTDDDFETIRIHLSAFKEGLCNQRRWKEAEDYERLISRFMSFASAQSKTVQNISDGDLIDRQAAINALNKLDVSDGVGISSIACSVQESAISAIQHLPSAQPERKRGKWKRKIVDNGFNADWACSECGYRVKTDFVNFNYCPNCGADMRGEQDEGNRR